MARFSFYRTKQWEKLRQFVINRDNGICVKCGGRGNIAHHIIFVDDSNCNDPNIVWNPDKLECVCQTCHNVIHHGLGGGCCQEGLGFDSEGNLIKLEKGINKC